MKVILKKRENGTYSQITDYETGPTKVQQQFKDESNINKIMEKYHKGIAITHLNRKQGIYGDFSSIKDYRDSLSSVISAQKSFMELPSGVRKRFNNDPQRLIDFVQDKQNYDEAVQLGLIAKPASANTQTTTNDDAKMAKPS